MHNVTDISADLNVTDISADIMSRIYWPINVTDISADINVTEISAEINVKKLRSGVKYLKVSCTLLSCI